MYNIYIIHIYIYYIYVTLCVDGSKALQGNISYIALEPGQYLDIAREGAFQPAFD